MIKLLFRDGKILNVRNLLSKNFLLKIPMELMIQVSLLINKCTACIVSCVQKLKNQSAIKESLTELK